MYCFMLPGGLSFIGIGGCIIFYGLSQVRRWSIIPSGLSLPLSMSLFSLWPGVCIGLRPSRSLS